MRASTALNCLTANSFAIKATKSGALNGKTFVVKDLFALKGHISSFGNAGWRDTHQPGSKTAPIINKLLNSGADMVGIAKMDPLAYSVVGECEDVSPLNSLYPDRFAGGSSCGSASAVAGGIADFALGTDTGGSIRVPAAACGLYSIRPTYGRLDSQGVLPLARSFDTVGVLAKDPTILKQVFNVLSPNSKPCIKINRILLPIDCLDRISTAAAKAIEEAASHLASLHNLKIEKVKLGILCDAGALALSGRLQNTEIWEEFGEWVLQHKASIGEDVFKRISKAEKIFQRSEKEKQADGKAWQEYKDTFTSFVAPDCIVIVPIIYDLPPKVDATPDELETFRNLAYLFSEPSSLSGAPQVVKPLYRNGITYGMGLLGAVSNDNALLELL